MIFNVSRKNEIHPIPFRPACRLGMGKGEKRLIIIKYLFAE
jgi:hypothetical protein